MVQTSNLDNKNIKEVNAITIRWGKTIDGASPPPNSYTTTMSSNDDVQTYEVEQSDPILVPFTQSFWPKGRNLELEDEILKQLKQVKINLSLLHVIKRVPNYAKLIKDLCTFK